MNLDTIRARGRATAEETIDLLAEIETLREWQVQHGMGPGMAEQPDGHKWGHRTCWCDHRVDHVESPLVLARQAILARQAALADVAALRSDLSEARADLAESEQIRDQMTGILNRVAVALKGPPEPLQQHDWSDLPGLARDAVVRLPRIKVERVEPDLPLAVPLDTKARIVPQTRATVTIRLRDREYRFHSLAWECSLESLPEGWVQ